MQLCGELVAWIGGRDVAPLLRGRQGRALFAYLVLHRERPISRDELIDALWPTDPPASPGACLSSVLARMRPGLGASAITGRGQLVLTLGPDAEVDTETVEKLANAAERALAAREPSAAAEAADRGLEIAGRRLLPELDLPWVEEKRRELGDTEERLLECRARAGLEMGGDELVSAERAAAALTVRHEFHEAAWGLLMEAQARRVGVAEALRTYDRLRLLLRDKLGIPPPPGLAALHQGLLRDGSADPGPHRVEAAVAPRSRPERGAVALPARLTTAADRPFAGRQDELERLRASWLGAREARAQLALVVGEPGIGKTRLAGRLAETVHAEGATVLYGRCDEETVVPYQPFIEGIRHCLRHSDWAPEQQLSPDLQALAQLIPEVRSHLPAAERGGRLVDAETERYRLFEAVLGLLLRWAEQRPLLFVLDDLQWAEKPTLLLLRHILRHDEAARLMLLGTLREDRRSPDGMLQEALGEPAGRFCEVRLGGLDEHATDTIVAARLNARPTPGFVRALRLKTDGNPFFIEEALRSLVDSGALESAPAAAERLLERMNVPKRVQELAVLRLARTSPTAADAVRAAAVIARAGRDFELATLEAVLDESPDAVLSAVEEAIDSGLVVELPGRLDTFAFCHALVRDAIYADMSTSRRMRLHVRVAEVLERRAARDGAEPGDAEDDRPVPSAELAFHFWTARERVGPERAMRYLRRAAQEAAQALAYEEAVTHYERALEAFRAARSGADEAERCNLLLALGRVQWHAGESAARDSFREVAASAKRRQSAAQLARAALGLGERYWEADPREVRGYLLEALRMLGDDDSALGSRLLARLGQNLHFTAEYAEAQARTRDAVEMARRLVARGPADSVANRVALLSALMGRHVALLDIGHLPDRLQLVDEIRMLADSRRELSGELLQWWMFDLCELGDVNAARALHTDLERLAHELRQPLFQHVARAWRAVFAHLDGDLAASERLAREAHELGEKANTHDAWSTLHAQLFMLRRRQGDIKQLLPQMEKLSRGLIAPQVWSAALAVAYVETGAVETGRALYERFAERRFDTVPRGFLWLTTIVLLAEVCAALEDRAGADVLYAALLPYAGRHVQVGLADHWGAVDRYLGLLAATRSDEDAARRHYAQAIERNGAISAPLLVEASERAVGLRR